MKLFIHMKVTNYRFDSKKSISGPVCGLIVFQIIFDALSWYDNQIEAIWIIFHRNPSKANRKWNNGFQNVIDQLNHLIDFDSFFS